MVDELPEGQKILWKDLANGWEIDEI